MTLTLGEAGAQLARGRLGGRPSPELVLGGGWPWGGQIAGRPRLASWGWCLTTASRAARPAQGRPSALPPAWKPGLLPVQSTSAFRPSSDQCPQLPSDQHAGLCLSGPTAGNECPFFSVGPGAVSPPPGSPHTGCSLVSFLFCSPGCPFGVSGAQIDVCFMARTGPQVWGQQLARAQG